VVNVKHIDLIVAVCPLKTVTTALPIVYSPQVDTLRVVIVSSMNKKEDPVEVDTCPRSIKNNVILLLNVEIREVVVYYLELAKNETQTTLNQTNRTKPLV
jgi:hypothetical protein